MLEHPEVKTATRNMFYDEQGKYRHTKKEILDEQGNLRAGCSIIPKGEVYESHIFTTQRPIRNRKHWSGNIMRSYGRGKIRQNRRKKSHQNRRKGKYTGKVAPLPTGSRQQPKQSTKKKSMDRER